MKERFQISKYLQIIQRTDNNFALYHSLYGGLCIVDKNIKEVLKSFQTPKSEQEALIINKDFNAKQINSFIQIFRSKNFLVKQNIDEYSELNRRIQNIDKQLNSGCQIGVVQLVLSNLCNFKCEYCFINHIYSSKERLMSQKSSKNKMMSTKQAQIYLEQTIKLIKKNGNRSLSIQFFGGEPLINWETMKFVLTHFSDGEKYGIKIHYSIVTNGSLINDEIAEYCKIYNVAVIVSFDSPRGKDRMLNNGKSSYKKIIHGLGILNKYKNRIIFNSVLSDETFEYFDTDLIDFALQYKVFEIGVLLDLNPKFYKNYKTKDIVDKLWKVYLYGKQKGVILTGYWHMVFQQITKHKLFEARNFKTCSGTGAQLSIEPSGDVFACKGSSGYFGNILDIEKLLSSKNYRKYALRSFLNPPDCRACEIENFCSGFCLGPLEKKYGDIYVVEKNTCNTYKEITKRLIKDIKINDIETYNMPKENISYSSL